MRNCIFCIISPDLAKSFLFPSLRAVFRTTLKIYLIEGLLGKLKIIWEGYAKCFQLRGCEGSRRGAVFLNWKRKYLAVPNRRRLMRYFRLLGSSWGGCEVSLGRPDPWELVHSIGEEKLNSDMLQGITRWQSGDLNPGRLLPVNAHSSICAQHSGFLIVVSRHTSFWGGGV